MCHFSRIFDATVTDLRWCLSTGAADPTVARRSWLGQTAGHVSCCQPQDQRTSQFRRCALGYA